MCTVLYGALCKFWGSVALKGGTSTAAPMTLPAIMKSPQNDLASLKVLGWTCQLKKPGSNKILGEIDAAAVADDCAILAEVKTPLTDEAPQQLFSLLTKIQ